MPPGTGLWLPRAWVLTPSHAAQEALVGVRAGASALPPAHLRNKALGTVCRKPKESSSPGKDGNSWRKNPSFQTQAYPTQSVRGPQRPGAPRAHCGNTLICPPSPGFPLPSLNSSAPHRASWVTSQTNHCTEILVSGSAWVGIQA